jgi:Retrotransposon gag protein/Zinc knuckle
MSAPASSSPLSGPSSPPTAQQYETELARLRQALAQQQAIAHAATQAAQAAASVAQPPAVAPQSMPSHMRPNKPSTFSGGCSGTRAEQWLLELQRFRSASEPVDDATFMRFVATFLLDAASRWYSQLCADVQTTPNTWVEFEAAFRQRFRPIDDERSARIQLLNIKQAPGEPITVYSDRFLNLLNSVPDMNVKDQIACYHQGLLRHIGAEVDKSYENITTVNAAIAAANQIEARMANFRNMNATASFPSQPRSGAPSGVNRNGFGRGPQMGNFRGMSWSPRGQPTAVSHYYPAGAAGGPAAADPNRMDLSQLYFEDSETAYLAQQQQLQGAVAFSSHAHPHAMSSDAFVPQHPSQGNAQYLAAMNNQGRPFAHPVPPRPMFGGGQSGSSFRTPGLTRPEFDQLSREGKCFHCKQVGHLARNCPKLRPSLN